MKISLAITPLIFPRLSRDIETAIFRVIQEALTNVYRHAASDSVRVEIEKRPECALVRVRDYGKRVPLEFGSSAGSSTLGVGISGMRERFRQFGGDLKVTRAEPDTLVECRIPLFG
jgi:two-component system NarL family sensor kinase